MDTSGEEDCDDLPSITVNSSANNSSTFAMPSADELAEQRARDLERERALDELHARALHDERVAQLRHSDSSGSEGELALAAAAAALRVREPPRAARPAPPAPAAAALWAALVPRLPPPGADLPRARLPHAVDALAAALAAERGPWPDDELHCGVVLLSVAALARDSRARRSAARTLHALLDDCASPQQVRQVTGALLAALPDARLRLQLGDVLRSGAGAGADRAARALCEAALLDLLGDDQAAQAREAGEAEQSEGLKRAARAAASWRACDADSRGLAVQLAGRLLAAQGAGQGEGEEEARARLLAQLAPPPAAASDAHRPDRLKAAVAASKLQLLFSAKNGGIRESRTQRVTSTSTNHKMEIENKT